MRPYGILIGRPRTGEPEQEEKGRRCRAARRLRDFHRTYASPKRNRFLHQAARVLEAPGR